MLRQPRLLELRLEADAGPRDENPFDGITTLLYIVQRSQTDPRTFWALASIWHICKYTVKSPKYITNTNLKGNESTGNQGYLDVRLCSLEALPFLTARIPQELGLPVDLVERKVAQRMETHELYSKFGKAPPAPTDEADTIWLVGQRCAMRGYVFFVQD